MVAAGMPGLLHPEPGQKKTGKAKASPVGKRRRKIEGGRAATRLRGGAAADQAAALAALLAALVTVSLAVWNSARNSWPMASEVLSAWPSTSWLVE